MNGPVIATLAPDTMEWTIKNEKLAKSVKDIQHLFMIAKNDKLVELDWISFE